VTLAVDSSALVRRYVHDRHRALVLDTMAGDDAWCASALCRSETLLALHRLALGPHQQAQLWQAVREDWAAFVVVPVDDRCLARATDIGATFGVRSIDAIHLAAADRLPRPVRYLTFDRRQIPAAVGLGFEVISPIES
jgi:predicted nucleic acid-binding protein